MTWAAFRTSDKFYTKRPPANCRAARFAWDELAKDGPIESMRLLDGSWSCERPGEAVLDEVDAAWVRQMTWVDRVRPMAWADWVRQKAARASTG